MKLTPKSKATAWLCALTTAAIVTGCAFDTRLKTVRYTVTSPKITHPLRLAVVSDVHSCAWGAGMDILLTAVRRTKADALLLPGDIFDDELPPENTWTFLRVIAAEIPTYYVTGNHEIAWGGVRELKAQLRACGITVLDGDAVPLTVRGQTILLAGADDPLIGKSDAAAQRKAAREAAGDAFSVLLSHRPELAEDYAKLGFDLVVSGHAHGGQWRIPGLLNGVYAPHQGPFPAYAGGRYDLPGTTLIVSRGLARETTPVPRIFNRPEVVVVEVRGKETLGGF